jgi:hypothetical protein
LPPEHHTKRRRRCASRRRSAPSPSLCALPRSPPRRGVSYLWVPVAARATAEDGPMFWTKVVGVDAVRASDRKLFPMLKWGGMEVELVASG